MVFAISYATCAVYDHTHRAEETRAAHSAWRNLLVQAYARKGRRAFYIRQIQTSPLALRLYSSELRKFQGS